MANALVVQSLAMISVSANLSLTVFTERTDAEAKAPILWPPDVKSRLIRKDPDAGKD